MPLTRKQKWRIDKVQSEKIARADKASLQAESQLESNEKEHTGIVITRYGQRQLVEDKNGEIFQCVSRQNIGFSVAGDQVLFKKQNKTMQSSLQSIQEKLNSKGKTS